MLVCFTSLLFRFDLGWTAARKQDFKTRVALVTISWAHAVLDLQGLAVPDPKPQKVQTQRCSGVRGVESG